MSHNCLYLWTNSNYNKPNTKLQLPGGQGLIIVKNNQKVYVSVYTCSTIWYQDMMTLIKTLDFVNMGTVSLSKITQLRFQSF